MSRKGPRRCGDEKSEAIYRYIVAYKAANDGLSPSVREMMRALGIVSTSIVNYHINRLESAGRITRHGSRGKWGIKIPNGEWRMKG